MTNKHKYEIGGLCVEMTVSQAERWNSGSATARDLADIQVHIPSGPHGRYITMRRALNERLEPEASAQLSGMPANRIR